MLTLSEKHITIICSDIKRSNIYYSHLPGDLLDHICCDVEHIMEGGIQFSDAYNEVKRKIGFHGLERIQEDTLFLTDKLYNTMKTIFKISGALSAITLSVASILKMYHITGASMLIFAGFVLCILLFLPSSLITLYKETRNNKLLFQFIAAFIAGMLILSGYLFKIMHWPGANIVMLSAAVSVLFLFFPLVFVNKKRQRPDKSYIYLIGLVCAEMYMTGVLFKFFHWPGATILITSGTFLFIVAFIPIYIRKTFIIDSESSGKFLFIALATVWYFSTTSLISMRLKEEAKQFHAEQSINTNEKQQTNLTH